MEGKITRIISNLYTVTTNDKSYDCRARGKFRKDKLTPLVGDIVEFESTEKMFSTPRDKRTEDYITGRFG